LKITSAAALDLDVNQLTLASGGLLSTGTTASTISGTGALGLTAGAGTGHELIVHQYNTHANGLAISAVIGNNGANAVKVTKAGTGNLILSGANTFTGQLTVQGGTLSVPTVNNVSTDGPLGNSASAVIIGNAGRVRYTGNTASSDKPFTMAAGGSGRFEVSTGGQTLTLSGVIDGAGGLHVNPAVPATPGGILKLTGANTYTGVTTITGSTTVSGSTVTSVSGILEVDNLQNAGVASSLGAYAIPGSSGIVLNGGTLRYTGPNMTSSIDRGITLLLANSAVNLPNPGVDMRIRSLDPSSSLPVSNSSLLVSGAGVNTNRLYIDSITVPTETARSNGVSILPHSASVTIGTINGNGNINLMGSAGDNIVTGPIHLGRGHLLPIQQYDHRQVHMSATAGVTWTLMSDNIFDGRLDTRNGITKIKSPGTLISGQNVSYAFGKTTYNWAADDTINNYKTHMANGTIQLLNDVSTSYETGFAPGQGTSAVIAGSGHTIVVDRQGGSATNQTHKLGNIFIRENFTLTVTGNNGFGLTVGDVRLEDTRTQIITTNTNLTLGKVRKMGGGTNSMTFRGTGTITVNGNIEEAAGGTLTITKSEAGTLILLGANTTANNTTLSGGTLIARHQSALGALPGSNVTVGAGTSLQYNATADLPLSIGGTLGITGGTTRIGGVIGSTFTSAQISSAGNATATAANLNIDIYGNSFSTATDGDGTYTLVKGNGGADTLNNATLTLGTVFNNTNFTVGALTTPDNTKIDVVIDAVTPLPTAYWKGTATAGLSKVWAASNGLAAGSDSNWTDINGGASSPLVPGAAADVIIASSSVTVGGEPTGTRLGADMTIKSLTISDAGGLGLNADPYQLTITTGGITTTSAAGPSTIAAKVALGANQTWTVDPANLLTVSGVVSGASNLTKAGTGTLVFSGAGMGTSGYTGLTTVAEGTLQLGVNSGIRHNNAVTVAPTGASATLDLAGFSQTIGGAGLTLGGGGTSSAASVIGTGTLTLNGGATAVTYNEANDPLGATISATKILLADAPQTFTVGDSATVISTGNELTISSTITQLGALTALVKAGTGTLKLDGAQDYNILTVNDGTANVNGILGTGSGTAVVTVNDTVGGVATKLRFGSVSQTLSSLTIGAGATVVFTSGAASGALTGDDGGGKAAGFGSPASSFGGGATVPEPGTLGLLLVGALGMLNRRRRA
jgi:fibronectin-binding autotransporter adhesin